VFIGFSEVRLCAPLGKLCSTLAKMLRAKPGGFGGGFPRRISNRRGPPGSTWACYGLSSPDATTSPVRSSRKFVSHQSFDEPCSQRVVSTKGYPPACCVSGGNPLLRRGASPSLSPGHVKERLRTCTASVTVAPIVRTSFLTYSHLLATKQRAPAVARAVSTTNNAKITKGIELVYLLPCSPSRLDRGSTTSYPREVPT
jgi:hypothetical protein